MDPEKEENSDPEIEESDEESSPAETIKKLRQALKNCQKERRDYLESAQRLKADYLNLKKASENEQAEVVKFANQVLLGEFLELADIFELAFADKKTWEGVAPEWRRGIEQIYSKLTAILRRQGVDEISAAGVPFDPTIHQSVGAVETENQEEDNVVMVITQKGYSLHGKTIRPAQVKVGYFRRH